MSGGTLTINHAGGFPTIGDRYGSDLERHRFMSLLCGWMNRTYTEAAAAADPQPGTMTIAEQQTALEKLKEYRLWYICRKYLPVSGKQCQYWKNCPKKPSMPDDPASVAARDAEVERRRQHQHQHQQATVAAGPLPKITKLKPQPQTFEWHDEDWTTLSVGLVKSRRRLPDVKHICPKCTLTVHKVHLGWPPETPVVGR